MFLFGFLNLKLMQQWKIIDVIIFYANNFSPGLVCVTHFYDTVANLAVIIYFQLLADL